MHMMIREIILGSNRGVDPSATLTLTLTLMLTLVNNLRHLIIQLGFCIHNYSAKYHTQENTWTSISSGFCLTITGLFIWSYSK